MEKKNNSLVIGVYKITYQNGVEQTLNLISQNDYANVVKPLLYEIDRLEGIKEDASAVKAKLSEITQGQYFTTESPIFNAAQTGILSIPGLTDKKCRVELLT
jgi:hypothetical protein